MVPVVGHVDWPFHVLSILVTGHVERWSLSRSLGHERSVPVVPRSDQPDELGVSPATGNASPARDAQLPPSQLAWLAAQGRFAWPQLILTGHVLVVWKHLPGPVGRPAHRCRAGVDIAAAHAPVQDAVPPLAKPDAQPRHAPVHTCIHLRSSPGQHQRSVRRRQQHARWRAARSVGVQPRAPVQHEQPGHHHDDAKPAQSSVAGQLHSGERAPAGASATAATTTAPVGIGVLQLNVVNGAQHPAESARLLSRYDGLVCLPRPSRFRPASASKQPQPPYSNRSLNHSVRIHDDEIGTSTARDAL